MFKAASVALLGAGEGAVVVFKQRGEDQKKLFANESPHTPLTCHF